MIEQFDVTREQATAVLEFVLRACAPTRSPPVLVLSTTAPKGLARALSGHTVHTAQAKGWDIPSKQVGLPCAGH